MKVLVVERAENGESAVCAGLRNNGDVAGLTRDPGLEDAVWHEPAAERRDAIVLDVMLPGMDGFETLAEPAQKSGRWTPGLLRRRATPSRSDLFEARRRRLPADKAVLVRRAACALALDRASRPRAAADDSRSRRPATRSGDEAVSAQNDAGVDPARKGILGTRAVTRRPGDVRSRLRISGSI